MAQDLGPHGINVNCIAPGTITTGRVVATVMSKQANANRDRTEQAALCRLGGVEDCAKVVELLTIELSDYVTGQCIAIDGGWCGPHSAGASGCNRRDNAPPNDRIGWKPAIASGGLV